MNGDARIHKEAHTWTKGVMAEEVESILQRLLLPDSAVIRQVSSCAHRVMY